MKQTNTTISQTVTALTLMFGSASFCSAAVLASEDFGAGSTGFPALDASTGSGWAAGWTSPNGTGQRSNASSLDRSAGYMPSGGDTGFLSNGERTGRNLDTTAPAFASYLDGSGNIGADGQTIYIAATFGGTNVGGNYYGLELHRDGDGDANRILQIADELGGGIDLRPGPPTTASTAENLFSQTNSIGDYFVLQITFGAGDNDTATLYRNPNYNQPQANSTAIGTISGTDMSFDRISFGNFRSGNTIDFDDIRVGETWADVAGVPEPSSTALLGLGGIALILRRRKA